MDVFLLPQSIKYKSLLLQVFLLFSQLFQKYKAQALIATEKTNCIVDLCEESRDSAEKLKHVPQGKRGSLYGLPISIKECFYVKGYDHTNGLAKEIDKPSDDDGSFVKVSVSIISIFSHT